MIFQDALAIPLLGIGFGLATTSADAHGGRTDAYGCHHNRKAGGYHCHSGTFANRHFSSKGEMLGATSSTPGGASPVQDNRKLDCGSVAAIHDNQAGCHGATVSLECMVASLKVNASRRGNTYYTFFCDQGKDQMTVFSFGSPEFRQSQRVRVVGKYEKFKRVGRYTFFDQIDASKIEVMPKKRRPETVSD